MSGANTNQVTGMSLKQQIRLVEQRLIGRRLLLRDQVFAVRHALHQKVTESVNVLLIAGVVFVLGYFASRRASTTSATSQSASVSPSASRPTGVLSTFLRLITNGLRNLAALLAFTARIMDAMSMVRFIQHFFAQSSTHYTPVHHAFVDQTHSTAAVVVSDRTMEKRQSWLPVSMLIISIVTLLTIVGWLYLSAQS